MPRGRFFYAPGGSIHSPNPSQYATVSSDKRPKDLIFLVFDLRVTICKRDLFLFYPPITHRPSARRFIDSKIVFLMNDVQKNAKMGDAQFASDDIAASSRFPISFILLQQILGLCASPRGQRRVQENSLSPNRKYIKCLRGGTLWNVRVRKRSTFCSAWPAR
jgi:hypothetical protein